MVFFTQANKIQLNFELDFYLDPRDANLVEVGVKGLEAEQETPVKVARKNGPYAVRAIKTFADFLHMRIGDDVALLLLFFSQLSFRRNHIILL